LEAQWFWGMRLLQRGGTPGDSRAAAAITGLVSGEIRQLQRDLKIVRKTERPNPADSEDLRALAIQGAVERDAVLRPKDGALLVQFINEHGLELSPPEVDGQSTRLDPARWDPRTLLAELADEVSKLAVPYSPRATDLRVAAHRGIGDELKRRNAAK